MTKVVFVQPFEVNERLAQELEGRVVVLDVAFCADTPRASFATTTLPFINALGDRLVLWIDHHEHERHADFRNDPRFVLVSRKEHPATPEMITPELVQRTGYVNTIVAHGDFDGIVSAAKWILGGEEPYLGADNDARAIDSRRFTPSPLGDTLDKAIKARITDNNFRQLVLRFLVSKCSDADALAEIEQAKKEYEEVERNTEILSRSFIVENGIAYLDIRNDPRPVDMTRLLMAGQRKAAIAVVRFTNKKTGEAQITIASPTDSPFNFVSLFGLKGGMPTRVTLPDSAFDEVKGKLSQLLKRMPLRDFCSEHGIRYIDFGGRAIAEIWPDGRIFIEEKSKTGYIWRERLGTTENIVIIADAQDDNGFARGVDISTIGVEKVFSLAGVKVWKITSEQWQIVYKIPRVHHHGSTYRIIRNDGVYELEDTEFDLVYRGLSAGTPIRVIGINEFVAERGILHKDYGKVNARVVEVGDNLVLTLYTGYATHPTKSATISPHTNLVITVRENARSSPKLEDVEGLSEAVFLSDSNPCSGVLCAICRDAGWAVTIGMPTHHNRGWGRIVITQ